MSLIKILIIACSVALFYSCNSTDEEVLSEAEKECEGEFLVTLKFENLTSTYHEFEIHHFCDTEIYTPGLIPANEEVSFDIQVSVNLNGYISQFIEHCNEKKT